MNYILTSEGMWLPGGNYQYYLKDHLGNTRLAVNTSGPGGTVVQQTDYYPFGMDIAVYNGGLDNKYRYNGKEFQDDVINSKSLSWYDYGARFYDPAIGRWHTLDPLADQAYEWSPYRYGFNNPIKFTDPSGMLEDWVERDKSKKIEWDDKVTSKNDKDLQKGDKYLGKNVLVATHNRDEKLNEPINSAKFDLYLESNKEGPSATIMGNTVPADVTKYGTLAEGVYPAKYSDYHGDGALLINGGGNLPTANGNPNNLKNYDVDGNLKPVSEHILDGVYFHKGNFGRESLWTLPNQRGIRTPISTGCQTGGCGKGSLSAYREFIKNARGFNGNYYLRKNP